MHTVLIANRGEIAVRVARAGQGCRAPVGRGVCRSRPGRGARPRRRRGLRAGRIDAGRLLSEHRQAARRRRPVRRGRRPPGIRVPVRERRIRAGRHRRRARPGSVRPRSRSAISATRSPPGTSPCGSALRWFPAPPNRSPAPTRCVAFAERVRAAGGDQGCVRRRRSRAQGGPYDAGDPGAVRLGGAGGGQRLRPRRVFRGALSRPPAARRGAGAGRHPRHRHRRRHPRLLAAAPLPEARRGGAGAVPDRGPAGHHSSSGQGDLPRGRLPRGRHRRVPGRPGRDRSRSSRSTPDSRWSIRSRRRPAGSTWCASSSASPTARGCAGQRIPNHAGTPSSSGSTARTRAAASCRRRAP